MSRFQFDPTPSPGSNRAAALTDCATCGGDRMVPTTDDPHGPYTRCPDCNNPAANQSTAAPDSRERWWQE